MIVESLTSPQHNSCQRTELCDSQYDNPLVLMPPTTLIPLISLNIDRALRVGAGLAIGKVEVSR